MLVAVVERTVVVAAVAVVVVVVAKNKRILLHITMGYVILRLGSLLEPWKSEDTPKDLCWS